MSGNQLELILESETSLEIPVQPSANSSIDSSNEQLSKQLTKQLTEQLMTHPAEKPVVKMDSPLVNTLENTLENSRENLGENSVETKSENILSSNLSDTSKLDSYAMSLPAALCDEVLLSEINSIPQKMAFKIGDVAEILDIKPYVLRYWESEFDILRPRKASNNQRMYTRKDVENALLSRKLLDRDRFSIEGARQAMKELKAHVKKERNITEVFHKIENANESIHGLIDDIRRLRKSLI